MSRTKSIILDIEPLDRVEIVFHDSWYQDEHWMSLDEIDNENEPCRSLGFFIDQNDTYIAIAQTVGQGQLGHLFHIPIQSIVSIEHV